MFSNLEPSQRLLRWGCEGVNLVEITTPTNHNLYKYYGYGFVKTIFVELIQIYCRID